MCLEDMEQPVRFVEPHDDGKECYLVDLVAAREEMHFPGRSANTQIVIKVGQPVLA